jgi:hypothetical protein
MLNCNEYIVLILLVIFSFLGVSCGTINPNTYNFTYFVRPSWTPEGKIAYFQVELNTSQNIFDGDVTETKRTITLKKMSSYGTEESDSNFVVSTELDKNFSGPCYHPNGSQWAVIIGNKLNIYDSLNNLVKTYSYISSSEVNPQLAWNPQGTAIAYSAYPSSYNHKGISVLTLSTETVSQIIPTGDIPSWSSDGEFVVYCYDYTSPDNGGVYLWDISDQQDNVLIKNGDGGYPDVYQNSKIIYVSDNKLIKYNLNTATTSEVYTHTKPVCYPRWSPDGKSLVFTEFEYQKDYSSSYGFTARNICVVNEDGTAFRRLKETN